MIARVFQWRELERWLPGGESSWEAAFPLVPLGDFLRRVVRPVDKSERPLESLNVIEKISFGGKLHVRRAKKVLGYKGPLFEALPGELIISKIRVAQGSLCVVPETLEHLAVSAEYPTYKPDPKQVRLRYLNLLLRTPNFQQLLCSSTSGNTTKKRLRPDDFEQVEIPLPEPDEQDQLLDGYEKALGKSAKLDADALALEQRAIHEFEAALGLVPPPDLPRKPIQITSYRKMDRWTHEAVLQEELLGNNRPESSFDFVPLEDVARVTYGIQKCPSNRPGKHARPYLRVANVQRNYLDLSVIKQINVPDADMRKLALREGDLLLCEGNSPDLVGRGAIWREEIPDCVHQNHVLRVRVINRKRVMPEFILEYINSPQGQAYFRSKAKWTTNLASINSKEVAAMPLPLPDTLKRQEVILTAVQRMRDKAAAKRTEAARVRSQAWADFLGAIFS
ncbi:MAG: hypothetical protein WC740_15250 [Verrucomicrobiia bacterium]